MTCLDRPSIVDIGQCDGTHARPMGIQPTHLHVPMKARPWPILRTGDVPVLHRIQVDVVAELIVIFVAANSVFSIARLPNTSAALVMKLISHIAITSTGIKIVMRESPLDLPPPLREIVILGRKGPDAVQVVG